MYHDYNSFVDELKAEGRLIDLEIKRGQKLSADQIVHLLNRGHLQTFKGEYHGEEFARMGIYKTFVVFTAYQPVIAVVQVLCSKDNHFEHGNDSRCWDEPGRSQCRAFLLSGVEVYNVWTGNYHVVVAAMMDQLAIDENVL